MRLSYLRTEIVQRTILESDLHAAFGDIAKRKKKNLKSKGLVPPESSNVNTFTARESLIPQISWSSVKFQLVDPIIDQFSKLSLHSQFADII